LKKLIVEKKNVPIDEIHILKYTDSNECYDNNEYLANDCMNTSYLVVLICIMILILKCYIENTSMIMD